MTRGDVVWRRPEFLYINPDGSATPMRVILLWRAKDPFAVTLRFPRGEEWLLARELVFQGVTSPDAGEGDVRFSRVPGCADCVLLELDCPSGYAALHVEREDLIDFLMATEFLPKANPVTEFDFDAWLRRLRQEMAS